VLLDRDSLIISYDPGRGEPRGKRSRAQAGEAKDTKTLGDCVDCGLCVDTCPTGIDIRDGLRMECVSCAQCIDACDAVMDKLGRPRGLVRYSSQARIDGEPGRILRPRVFVYPSILLVVTTLFVYLLWGKQSADVTLLRGFGVPFSVLPDGGISNQARLKITNRGKEDAAYRVDVLGSAAAKLRLDTDPIRVPKGESVTSGALVVVPEDVFSQGKYDVTLRVTDGLGFSKDLRYRLLGPASPERNPPTDGPAAR
jgi:cytochrome c oxidase accessory protein FixG